MAIPSSGEQLYNCSCSDEEKYIRRDETGQNRAIGVWIQIRGESENGFSKTKRQT